MALQNQNFYNFARKLRKKLSAMKLSVESPILFNFVNCLKYVVPWRSSYYHCTTSFKKSELRLYSGSNPVHDLAETCDGDRL